MTKEGNGYRVKPQVKSSGGKVVEVRVPGKISPGRLILILEQRLPAGQYAVWVKTGPEMDKPAAGQSLKLKVGLGSESQIVTFKNIQPETAAAVIINVSLPFQDIWLTPESENFRFQIDQIYLTSQPEDIRFDPTAGMEVVDLVAIMNELGEKTEFFPGYPVFPGNQEPENYLENGGFEVGLGSYYWSTPYQQSYSLQPHFWSKDQPAEGLRCLSLSLFPYAARFQGDKNDLPVGFQLMHKILKLQPEKTYYFRGLFRATETVQLTVTISPAYEQKQNIGQAKATIGNTWQPVTLEFRTTGDRRGYFLSFSATAEKPARLEVDALSLSSKKLEDFVPSSPVEIGVHWDTPGRVFYQGLPVKCWLLARNYGSVNQLARLGVRYQIYDYFDRLLLEKTVEQWALAPGTTGEKILALNPGSTGNFRLILTGQAELGSLNFTLPLQEYVFSVVPRPPEKMHHTFGAYITLAAEPIEIMSRAGIRRTVTLSCSNELLQTWRSIEPRPGEFIWADKRVDFAIARDMDIIANLDLGSGGEAIPQWARNPSDPEDAISCSGPRIPQKSFTFSRRAWANFVEKVVAHYRGKVSNYLFVDEPYHYMNPEEYADLIKISYLAAKKANPDCLVFIHGGYYPYWLPALEKAGAVPYFDAISDYSRTKEQGQRLREFSLKHSKPVINVEYRWQVSMYRTIETPDYLETREVPWYRQVTESILQVPIYAMGWSGGQGFNLYDARFPGGDFRQLDRYKCGFEYDGCLKPNMVGYAIMSQLLDGFRGVEELSLHPDLKTFLLKDTQQFALVVWTRDRTVLEATLCLPEKVRALDIMGNPCPIFPAPVLLSNSLLYLIGPEPALGKTKEMLANLKTQEAIRVKTEIISGKNSQYFFQVALSNNCSSRTISGQVQVTGLPLREFWKKAITSFASLGPQETITIDFGLNAYQPEGKVEQFDGEVLVYFDGVTYHQQMKSPETIVNQTLRNIEGLVKATDFQGAEEACRKFLQEHQDKRTEQVWLKLGGILVAQGKNEEALSVYQQMANLGGFSPESLAEAWYQQAKVLSSLSREEEALTALKKAASLPEGGYFALKAGYEAGRYYFLKCAYEKAIAEYSQVLIQVSSDETYRLPEVACSLLYRAKSLEALRKWEQAVSDYERLLSKPGVAKPYLQEAEKALERCRSLLNQ
ncbi:MAG: hypothetical protein NC911_02595 [Candidatus Omnitrophica bacterium]|nr:hypothetical protein [Candidatus Omnitrophota bacterium]